MATERLFAKSTDDELNAPDSIFLPGHLKDVLAGARTIVDTTGLDQLSAVGLDKALLPRFRRIVEFAAAVHDLGKANDHFQTMVQRTQYARQGLRHEWVSVVLCFDPEFGLRDWLLPAFDNEADFLIALWAVSGHHASYNRPSPPRIHVEGAGDQMSILGGNDDFRTVLEWLGKEFSLGKRPAGRNAMLSLVGENNAFQRILKFYRNSTQLWDSIDQTDEPDRALVAAAKNCLVAADIAGSAVPDPLPRRTDQTQWLSDGFARRPTSEDLWNLVADRLEVDAADAEKSLREFQQQVADSPSRVTYVKAGCGTGKTVAAYAWAARQHPDRRLYFCYPTTGTATQGFRDYLITDDEARSQDESTSRSKAGARLFHSRQDIDCDIYGVAESGADLDSDQEAEVRIRSLEAWSTPIVSCTCDVVLGLVQNNRRGLYAWPALAGSAFVFDEIHAYDDRLFGALLRFLMTMKGVSVLLMTASLPDVRFKALQRCLSRITDSQDHPRLSDPISGPEELETLPRYHRHPDSKPDKDTPEVQIDHARAELGRKKRANGPSRKVLWVCNTVRRAQEMFEAAKEADLPGSVLLYHSRFRYGDRIAQHNALIDAFQSDEPVLAVTTQVAEMSLDLKGVSLLITDLAPAASLIQRLGRLNRDARPPTGRGKKPPTMPFIVSIPRQANSEISHLPYTPEDMELAKTWLESLPESISQRDLAVCWEELNSESENKQRPALIESAWFDGGPQTRVLELREGSPGITAIRRSDAEEVMKLEDRRRQMRSEGVSPQELSEVSTEIRRVFGKATIPMPPLPQWIRDELKRREQPDVAVKLRGAQIVDETFIDYCEERGGRWQPKPKP